MLNFQMISTKLLSNIFRRRSSLFLSESGRAKPPQMSGLRVQRRRAHHSQITDEQKLKKLSEEEKMKEDLEQVRLMNEYFSQYVEEYYEEEEEDEEKDDAELATDTTKQEKRYVKHRPIGEVTPDKVVEFLREQRVKDIVCLRIPPSEGTHPYMVICTPYNARHADAITENMRKFIKQNYHYPGRQLPVKVETTYGWYILDMQNIVLHMMTEKVRALYDLETLHGIGDKEIALDADLDYDLLPPSVVKH